MPGRAEPADPTVVIDRRRRHFHVYLRACRLPRSASNPANDSRRTGGSVIYFKFTERNLTRRADNARSLGGICRR